MFDQRSFIDSTKSALFDQLCGSLDMMFGQSLDHHQYQQDPVGFGEQVLNESFTDQVKELMLSVRDNPVTVAVSANATGKSLPVDTPVLTPTGFIPMGDIRVGDQVIGVKGKPVRVLGVYLQGLQPTYQVTFNDKTSTLCSEDHLWAARSSSEKGRGRPFRIFTTRELKNILHRHMHIPMCEPVEFNQKEILLDPYVLGVLLGDGELGQGVRFACPDKWIIDDVRRRLAGIAEVKWYDTIRYGITTPNGKSNPVLDHLNAYGLIGCGSYEKHIPEVYIKSSVEHRYLLLAGLMDTDGTINECSSISFSTTSPALCQGVMFLVQSLGGTAKLTTRIPNYTHNGEKRSGRLDFRLSIKIPENPFRLPRKANRWRDPTTMQKQAHRLIKNISCIGVRESVCIKVDAEDGLFLIENFIVTHNTHAAARIAVWFYKAFEGAQVYTGAAPPESNLKKLLWGEIGSVTEKHPDLFKTDQTKALHIARSAQSFISGVTIPASGTEAQREAKFSGKHAPHLLFIIDEGDAVPDEVYRGIESCMSGGHARLLVMFNPRAEIGEAYRMIRDGRANVVKLSAFDHPNVRQGLDVIPGAVTRETTVRRINEWCRPLGKEERPGTDCFQLPAFLEGCTAMNQAGRKYPPLKAGWYKITQPAFSYMVLGEYPAQGTQQLISKEWTSRARARWDAYVSEHGENPPRGSIAIMGLDIGEFGTDANVACFRYGGFIEPLVSWSGVDTVVTGDRASAEYESRSVLYANVDATGVGAGVAPQMKRAGCSANSVKVASKPTEETELGEFGVMRDQLWWACREWLRTDPGAMLPPDEQLLEELHTPTYEVKNGKVKVMDKDTMRELLKRSPDRADSLCLSFYKPQKLFPEFA